MLPILAVALAAMPVAEKKPDCQYLIRVSVHGGDPLGNRSEGTLKTYAEPTLVAKSGETATFLAGSRTAVKLADGTIQMVPCGTQISFAAKPAKDNAVRVDCAVSHCIRIASDEDVQELQTVSVRKVTTVRLGEVVKMRIQKEAADQQMWLEFTVEEAKPVKQ